MQRPLLRRACFAWQRAPRLLLRQRASERAPLLTRQVTWDKTLDRMRKEQHAFQSAQEQERKGQEAQFRIARWKLQNQCKKEAEEKEEKERVMRDAQRVSGVPADTHHATPSRAAADEALSMASSGVHTDLSDVRPGMKTGAPGGEEAPNGADEELNEVWSCRDALTAWQWVNGLGDVRALLSNALARAPPAPLLLTVARGCSSRAGSRGSL